MRREHVAVLVLLLVLLVAVGLFTWSGRKSDVERPSTSDREPPVAGRELRLEELSGSCGRSVPPVVITQTGGPLGSCTIGVAATTEPFWSIPMLEQFLQPELRALTVRLIDCDAGAVEIGETREDLDAGEELSVAIQADGATIVFSGAPACRLATDVTS